MEWAEFNQSCLHKITGEINKWAIGRCNKPGLIKLWLIQDQIKPTGASCIGPSCSVILSSAFLLPSFSSFSFPSALTPRASALVDKPAGELIVTYMDLITLSITFGGPAFSDPWLIVVVIFQSLTAAHMLQTNPKVPTKPQWQATPGSRRAAHARPRPPPPILLVMHHH